MPKINFDTKKRAYKNKSLDNYIQMCIERHKDNMSETLKTTLLSIKRDSSEVIKK
jgi:hypothetical protein